MYTLENKKKGLMIIEVLVSLSILSFLAINIFLILNAALKIEKSLSDIFFNDLKLSRIFLGIEDRIKISQKYSIDRKSRIPANFEIPEKSLEKGNILYLYLNTVRSNKIENEIVIYSFIGGNLEIYYGKRLNNYVLVERSETEIPLKEIKGEFKKNSYSIELLGEMNEKTFRKEFY